MKPKGKQIATTFDEDDVYGLFWTDGKYAYFRSNKLTGADIDSFVQYPGFWAKDNRYCYLGSSKIKNVDHNTFEVLNFTYAKDKSNVWTLGGRISEVDAKTFEVCDDGKKTSWLGIKKMDNGQMVRYQSYVPYGYAKDKDRVYYYDACGKNKIVIKADAKTFVSLNDGEYGYDKNFVFCGKAVIPKANPLTWKKLHGINYEYSQDGDRIYYFNRLIKDADAKTFEVVAIPIVTGFHLQLAKDKNRRYWNDLVISIDEFEKKVDKELSYYKDNQNKMYPIKDFFV